MSLIFPVNHNAPGANSGGAPAGTTPGGTPLGQTAGEPSILGTYEGGDIEPYEYFKGRNFDFGQSMHEIFHVHKHDKEFSTLKVNADGTLSFNGDEWTGFGFGTSKGKERRNARKDKKLDARIDRKGERVDAHAQRTIARGTAQVELAKLGLQQQSVGAQIVGASGALAQGITSGLTGGLGGLGGGGSIPDPFPQQTPQFPQDYPQAQTLGQQLTGSYPGGYDPTATINYGAEAAGKNVADTAAADAAAVQDAADKEEKDKKNKTYLIVGVVVAVVLVVALMMKKKK